MNSELNPLQESFEEPGITTNQSLPAGGAVQNIPRQSGGSHAKSGMASVLVLVATLSITTGLLFFLHFHDFYTQDSDSYVLPATNLLSGHGFSDAQGNPETVRTPGYPWLILAILWCKLDLKYLIVLQHVIRVLVILGTTAFVLHVTASRRQALVAGLFLCIDLPLLEAANTVMSEALFVGVLAIVLWLLWIGPSRTHSRAILAISGLLGGAAVLIRPVALLFFLPATAYLFFAHRRFRLQSILSFSLAFALFPALWASRNYVETGSFTLSSIAGVNMLLYRAAGTLAVRDRGDFDTNLKARQFELEKQACDDLKKLYGKPCSEINPTQKFHYYGSVGKNIVLQHRADYLRLALRGAAIMMLGGGAERFSTITKLNIHLSRRILLCYTLPLFCAGLLGLWVLWKINRSLFFLIFLVISYFVLVSAGAEAYSRLRVPIEPLYAVIIAVGVESIVKTLSRLRTTGGMRP